MRVSDFDYELPSELIAQDPLSDRASSRLLVLDRHSGAVSHRIFRDIAEELQPGDCLVINNTRVIPARLLGQRRGSGGMVELLLLKRQENAENTWEVLVKPGKKCREGEELSFGNDLLRGQITQVLPDGNRLVHFEFDGIFEEILDQLGQMPLPPYITHTLEDKNRYQTVYAKYDGSAAAPTAGLHFTEDLLQSIRDKGVSVAEITLHVGLGTFRPVKADVVEDHHMHSEYYEVSAQAADTIKRAKQAGGRIIAVGTTSCRTLESAAGGDGLLQAGNGWTDIFIFPGYQFKLVDALITNFHLPKSTLMMLVSALAGREQIMAAYAEAIREKYRFFSFGDAMLIK